MLSILRSLTSHDEKALKPVPIQPMPMPPSLHRNITCFRGCCRPPSDMTTKVRGELVNQSAETFTLSDVLERCRRFSVNQNENTYLDPNAGFELPPGQYESKTIPPPPPLLYITVEDQKKSIMSRSMVPSSAAFNSSSFSSSPVKADPSADLDAFFAEIATSKKSSAPPPLPFVLPPKPPAREGEETYYSNNDKQSPEPWCSIEEFDAWARTTHDNKVKAEAAAAAAAAASASAKPNYHHSHHSHNSSHNKTVFRAATHMPKSSWDSQGVTYPTMVKKEELYFPAPPAYPPPLSRANTTAYPSSARHYAKPSESFTSFASDHWTMDEADEDEDAKRHHHEDGKLRSESRPEVSAAAAAVFEKSKASPLTLEEQSLHGEHEELSKTSRQPGGGGGSTDFGFEMLVRSRFADSFRRLSFSASSVASE